MEENTGRTALGGVRKKRGNRRAAGQPEREAGGGTRQFQINNSERQEQEGARQATVITFHIPGPLRSFAGGRSAVTVEAAEATVAGALQALWAACPGMRDRVVTEQGQVREHINIFLGNENIRYTGGLATRVPPGAEISIVPAISGGKTAENAESSASGA